MITRTVYTDLESVRHDEDFIPVAATLPCHYPAGSDEKIAAMRRRAEIGEDIWHRDDNANVLIARTSPQSGLRSAKTVISFRASKWQPADY